MQDSLDSTINSDDARETRNTFRHGAFPRETNGRVGAGRSERWCDVPAIAMCSPSMLPGSVFLLCLVSFAEVVCGEGTNEARALCAIIEHVADTIQNEREWPN